MSSTLSPLNTHPPPSYGTLRLWLESHGGSVQKSLEAVYDEADGWNVKAKEDIERGAILCIVPKSVILSHRTSDLTAHLPLDEEFSAADVTLHLAACLLYELLLGEASRFYPWLQILPRETVAIPTFWAEEDMYGADGVEALSRLAGTEGEKELHRKDAEGMSLDDLKFYYDEKISPLPSMARATFHHFLYAFSMVSTRGYVTDAHHTIALIPFCDLFNHSSRAHTSLLSDQCVCPVCGDLPACIHDSPDEDRISHLTPEYIIRVVKEGFNVEMRAERSIESGQQVYSCYEDGLGDGKLLVEWGFVGREESGQGVTWKAGEVLRREDGQAYMAITQRGRVLSLLREPGQGSSASCYLTDEPGLFNISPNGAVGSNVLVACGLGALQSAEWTDVEELEDGIVHVIKDALDQGQGDEAKTLRRQVGQLATVRLDAMSAGPSPPATPTADVSTERPLTAMADQLRTDEVELLRRVLHQWQ